MQTLTALAVTALIGPAVSSKLSKALPLAFGKKDDKKGKVEVTKTVASQVFGEKDDDEVEEGGGRIERDGKAAAAPSGRHIYISIPDHTVVLVDGSEVMSKYKAMLGDAQNPTPHGDFRILEQIPWHGSVMGRAWMAFDDKLRAGHVRGIHGLGPDHDPDATNGCVALSNDDVLDLYGKVSKGTPVTIFDRPYEYPFNPPPPKFQVPDVVRR